MADETAGTPQQAQGEQEQRQIQLRDNGVQSVYASFFTIAGGQDAVMISLGNQVAPTAIQIEQKTVLSPRNAKRMAVSLAQVIRRYEEEHGELDISVPQPEQQVPAKKA